MVAGGPYLGYDKIPSMSELYASYWNAFLFAEDFSTQLIINTNDVFNTNESQLQQK